MLLVRLGPTAELLVDRDELQLREAGDVGRIRRLRLEGPVEVPGDDLLRLRRVEELQIGLGNGAGAALVDHLVDHRHRRLGENGERGRDDVELVGAEFLHRQIGLVLPGDQHVAEIALDEGGGGAARARVEDGHVLVDRLDKGLGLAGVAIGAGELIGPGGEIIPPRAAGGLRVRRDDADAGLRQIGPVADLLRVALAHQQDDGRGVGRGIVRQPALPVGGKLAAVLRDGVDVAAEGKGDHVRLEAVDDRTGLAARAAVRGADRHLLAGLFPPMTGEGIVDDAVELARRIIGDVDERDRGLGPHGTGCADQGGGAGGAGAIGEEGSSRQGGNVAGHGASE